MRPGSDEPGLKVFVSYIRLAEVHTVSTRCERFAESCYNDNVVVQASTENIIYNTITC